MDAPLLTVLQVANLLNIGRTLIYKLIEQGELPSVKIGKTRRLRPKDVDAYIDRNTTGGFRFEPCP